MAFIRDKEIFSNGPLANEVGTHNLRFAMAFSFDAWAMRLFVGFYSYIFMLVFG